MPVYGLISESGAGTALALNLMSEGHTVVAFDYDAASRRAMAQAGIVTTSSVQAVLLHLPSCKHLFAVITDAGRKADLEKQLAVWLEVGDRVEWR